MDLNMCLRRKTKKRKVRKISVLFYFAKIENIINNKNITPRATPKNINPDFEDFSFSSFDNFSSPSGSIGFL